MSAERTSTSELELRRLGGTGDSQLLLRIASESSGEVTWRTSEGVGGTLLDGVASDNDGECN